MIAIQIAAVRAVMHPVVRRSVQHLLEPADRAHHLGVDPELIDQVEGTGVLDECRPHPGQRQHAIRHRPRHAFGDGLPQGGGEVVVLTAVMHHVHRPQPAALVGEPVVPVIDEVPAEQRQKACRPTGPEVASAERKETFPARLRRPRRGSSECGRPDGSDRCHAGHRGIRGQRRRWCARAVSRGLGDDARRGQSAVCRAPAHDVRRGRRDAGSDGGADQRLPPPADARCQGVEHALGNVRRNEAAQAHREAGDGVGQFVIPSAWGALRGGMPSQPDIFGTHRADVGRDREDCQVEASHRPCPYLWLSVRGPRDMPHSEDTSGGLGEPVVDLGRADMLVEPAGEGPESLPLGPDPRQRLGTEHPVRVPDPP